MGVTDVTQWRLAEVAPHLFAELEYTDEIGRRVVAAAIARAVVSYADLDDATIDRGLALLERMTREAELQADVLTMEALSSLIERLDEEYVTLRDRQREGEVSQREVVRSHERLRAATVVQLALRGDSMEAVAEACYEAIETFGGGRKVEQIAFEALDRYEMAGEPKMIVRALERSQRLSAHALRTQAVIGACGIAAVFLLDLMVPLPHWLQALVIGGAMFGLLSHAANWILCARQINELRTQ